jgi:hypothetical protein
MRGSPVSPPDKYWPQQRRHGMLSRANHANLCLFELAKNRHSTSLRFHFAYLANKRRKVAITPAYNNNQSPVPAGPRKQLLCFEWAVTRPHHRGPA